MTPRQANFEAAVGQVQVRAVQRGGEALLERVEAALGPAIRHLTRVTTGVIDLTDAVAYEIQQAITAAQDLVDAHR